MQPNQPYNPVPPAAPPPEQNPYDFIMNSGVDPKKSGSFNLPSGNSTKQRILIVGAGLLLLIFLGIFLLMFLSSGKQSNSVALMELAQEQTELIRIADAVSKETAVRSEDTRVLAMNTSLSVNSTKKEVVAIITRSGKKAEPKQLGLLKNGKTDTLLETAKQNNQYDTTALQILQNGLKAYRAKLKTTYELIGNDKDKKVLSDAYKGVGLLLGDNAPTTTN